MSKKCVLCGKNPKDVYRDYVNVNTFYILSEKVKKEIKEVLSRRLFCRKCENAHYRIKYR